MTGNSRTNQTRSSIFRFLSWGHWDGRLKIGALESAKLLAEIDMQRDEVAVVVPARRGKMIITGGGAGVVRVWKSNAEQSFVCSAVLYGHEQAISALYVSENFSTIVSGSADGTCILWDLNRLVFVNPLPTGPDAQLQLSDSIHEPACDPGPVRCIAMSETCGDIVCVWGSKSNQISLWTINGTLVASASSSKINCVAFASTIEGLCDPVIFTGHEDASVIAWSAWDLLVLRKLTSPATAPITAIALNQEMTQLITGDASGMITVWRKVEAKAIKRTQSISQQ
jgi:WD40 repeat protein